MELLGEQNGKPKIKGEVREVEQCEKDCTERMEQADPSVLFGNEVWV